MREKLPVDGKHGLATASLNDFIRAALAPLFDSLYRDSGGQRWALPLDHFCSALERSILKSLGPDSQPLDRIRQYVSALHIADLALATACASGSERAWDHFVATYRGYLRASAGAILRCSPDAPAAEELADSLYADLYGLGNRTGQERSLFRYFHGRSSLQTWLRAVLAQRHIDQLRSAKRQIDLDDEESERARESPLLAVPVQAPDPHRERYLNLFQRALETALAGLPTADLERLRSYYANGLTLAEIGRKIGEHESSVSRNLERVRKTLREKVEIFLREGFSAVNGAASAPGLSDAEIALSFSYASEDAPIDLDRLLAPQAQSTPPKGGKIGIAGKRVET